MTGKQATAQERAAQKQSVLADIADGVPVGIAARNVGLTRSALYDWRGSDEAFADAWQSITEDITDKLEQTALEYATSGFTEIKTIEEDGHVRVETHHKKDPNTLRFMLGARRRSTYGAKQEIEHSGEIGQKRIIWGDSPEPKQEVVGELEE